MNGQMIYVDFFFIILQESDETYILFLFVLNNHEI